MNGSTQDAEDALSTAMLRTMEKLPVHAPNVSNYKGWLIQLTRNVCIDFIRKRSREVLYTDNIENAAVERHGIGTQPRKSIEEKYLDEKKFEMIYDKIDQLPARLREPMLLRFFRKLPYREISHHLGLTDENARKRIQQAKNILQEHMNQKSGGLRDFLSAMGNVEQYERIWNKGIMDAEKILERRIREIDLPFNATRMVPVALPSGGRRNLNIFLVSPPFRRDIKIRTLEKYVKNHPYGWKKRVELAELMTAGGDLNRAVSEYRRALAKHPQAMAVRVRLGELFMKTQRPEAALWEFKHALPYVRKEATRYFLLGMMAQCRNQYDSAISAFSKAAALEPEDDIHRQKLGSSYLMADRAMEALQQYEKALAANPTDIVSLTGCFHCLSITGRIEKTGEYVQRILKIYPFDIPALKWQVNQLCRRGLVRGEGGKHTRELIRRMRKAAPDAPEAHTAAAEYHYFRGEKEKALTIMETLTRNCGGCIDSWYYYARHLYRSGEYHIAGDAIRRAMAMDENDDRVLSSACEIFRHAGRLMDLERVIQLISERFPHRWDCYSTAASAQYACFAEPGWAIELAEAAVQLQPLIPGAHFHLGRILCLSGKHTEAIEVLNRVWDLVPREECCTHAAPAAWWLAHAYSARGDKGQAWEYLRRVIDHAARLKRFIPAEGYYWEAKALHARGENRNSKDAFHNALVHHLFHPFRQEARREMIKRR